MPAGRARLDVPAHSSPAPNGLVTREQAVPSRVVRVDVFSSDELVAELHQSETHPDMPRGAVKVVWRELKARGLACLHVTSLQNGRLCWLVAVLLHIDGVYLAIHLRPASEDLLTESADLYERARRAESAAAARGLSRSKVADVGADFIVNELRDRGLTIPRASARLLEAEVVPASVRAAGKPRRAGAFGPLAALQQSLSKIRAVSDGPARGLIELGEIAALLEQLSDGIGHACDELQVMVTAASYCAQAYGGEAAVLRKTAEALDKVSVASLASLTEARGSLEEARHRTAHVRWWVAGARLLIDVIAADVDQRLTRGDGPGLEESFLTICAAMQSAVIEMAVGLNELPAELSRAAGLLDASLDELAEFHRWLSRYRLLVTKAGLWSSLPDFTAELDRQLAGVHGLDRQRRQAERLRRLAPSVSLDELAVHLETARTSAFGAKAWPSGQSTGRTVII